MFLFDTFQIAVKREPAVEKEMSKLDTDKKMSKKEKEERVLWKKNEVSRIGSKMKS
jgi:translocon-associated protein subunit gamma